MKILSLGSSLLLFLVFSGCKPVVQRTEVASINSPKPSAHLAVLHGADGSKCLAVSSDFAFPSNAESDGTTVISGAPENPTGREAIDRLCTNEETQAAADATRAIKSDVAQINKSSPATLALSKKGQLISAVVCSGLYMITKKLACELGRYSSLQNENALIITGMPGSAIGVGWLTAANPELAGAIAEGAANAQQTSALVNIAQGKDALKNAGSAMMAQNAKIAARRVSQMDANPLVGKILRACLVGGVVVEGIASTARHLTGRGLGDYCGE
jgi:hypothetical protein